MKFRVAPTFTILIQIRQFFTLPWDYGVWASAERTRAHPGPRTYTHTRVPYTWAYTLRGRQYEMGEREKKHTVKRDSHENIYSKMGRSL